MIPRLIVLIVGLVCASAPAYAQVYIRGEKPSSGSVEIGGGGTWASGFDLGRTTAELTRSGPQTDGYDLFTSEGDVNGFPGVHARVGVYLSRTISIEGGVRFAKPTLSYQLSGDAESAADETATETLSHYVFDGSVLFHFPGASFAGGRGIPFVSGGAGHIRELHEGNELVETGIELHATFGVKYWLGTGSRRLGIRGEIGLSAREDGFDQEEGRRTLPLALVGATFLF
jgi:hypothetical protein